jgi:hypothetical protein
MFFIILKLNLSNIVLASVNPFYHNGITHFKDVRSKLFVYPGYNIYILYFCDLTEISNFLEELDDNNDYVIIGKLYAFDLPGIEIPNPILVNKLSNKYLIQRYISNCVISEIKNTILMNLDVK